ncbi:MAG: hydrogenase expression/formation protein HypE [Candidatus Omnitrophota bacterium]
MGLITIAHGSGGKLTHRLIKDVFYKHLGNDLLNEGGDSAVAAVPRGRVAFTTDSFVIKPVFFPGGDIGKLSVCGTVNDLCVSGADPAYISCGFIIEEGFPARDLEEIARSMGCWAKRAGVKIIAGDTKVVEKGEADGVFINTAGIGFMRGDRDLGMKKIRPGDKIIINGNIGDHALSILTRRKGLEFESDIVSDCAPLNSMVKDVLDKTQGVRFMRDVTRGGLATTLNEIAAGSSSGVIVEEEKVPVSKTVAGAAEILGLDPMYLANEGKVIIIAGPESEEDILSVLRNSEYGAGAVAIGSVTGDLSGRVRVKTRYGVMRVADMLTAEHLPRIC